MNQIKEFAKKLEVLYEVFNWHWQSTLETPTAKEIEKTIVMLLKDCQKKDISQCSTGGISVFKEEGRWEIVWRVEKTLYLDSLEIKEILKS